MTQAKQRRVRGALLIESLFAVFLVAIVATIIAATMPLANNSRARADMLNKAVSIAQKQVENVRGVGYPNLNGPQLLAAGLVESSTADGNGRFHFTNVDSAAFDAPALVLPSGKGYLKIEQVGLDLRLVTVRVEWTDRGKPRHTVLSTMIANL